MRLMWFFSAVGITPNIEGIGLEEAGVKTDRGRVVVDEFYRTSVKGYMQSATLFPAPRWLMCIG